jgi:hypothetical protein
MTLSAVVERLLERGSSDRSSVTLTRNAKGETQIEVIVRASDVLLSVNECELAACAVYERLRARYPLSTGYVAAAAGKARDEAAL